MRRQKSSNVFSRYEKQFSIKLLLGVYLELLRYNYFSMLLLGSGCEKWTARGVPGPLGGFRCPTSCVGNNWRDKVSSAVLGLYLHEKFVLEGVDSSIATSLKTSQSVCISVIRNRTL